MKKRSLLSLLMLAGALITLPYCGGGGGSTPPPPPPQQPTTAVLTLSTAITGTFPATTSINGYDVTIMLPAGVTVNASPDSGNPAILDVASSVVAATGSASGAQLSAIYTPAAGGLPATVQVTIVSATGISAGAFCTLTCNIAVGTSLSASNFAQPTLINATGFDTSETTASLTQDLSLTETAVLN